MSGMAEAWPSGVTDDGTSGLWRGSTLLWRFYRSSILCFSYWCMLSDIFPPSCSYLSPDVNYEELARCTDDFNGAQCKAVCVEAVSILGNGLCHVNTSTKSLL